MGEWRNVAVLSAAQALGLAAAPLVILVGGIVGQQLAPAPSLATLPVAGLIVGTALSVVPAALLMRRIGRRAGFLTGSIFGLAGALLGAYATRANSFVAFCSASLLIGANLAFVQQYRFAAVESVTPERSGRAVSFVLLGGIAAGLIGPELGRRGRDWLDTAYTGSFLAGAAMIAAAAVMLSLLRIPAMRTGTIAGGAPFRPLVLLRRPGFLVAMAGSITAYATMSLIMTATPISMHVLDGHSLDATAVVIQTHVVAMFAPSLFSGALVDRLGAKRMMHFGVMALAGCVALASSSHALAVYTVALALLGVGWNFLFIGGTVLLTRSYHPDERFRAQALHDFLVFGVQAAAALGAGAVLHRVGWSATNLLVLPLVLLMFVMLVTLGERAQAGLRESA